MKKYIFLTFLIAVVSVAIFADDYIDDIYYSPTTKHSIQSRNKQSDSVQPRYKDGAKEIIFIEDSVPSSKHDTIEPKQINQTERKEKK